MPETSLLQRLKRRKLVQWAIAYSAGAFFLYSALDPARETWGIPSIFFRVIHVLLIAGFFITLVLAWYHGEKGRQRASGPEILMVAALLVIAGVAISLLGKGQTDSELGDALSVPSTEDGRVPLAVMPFTDHSPNPEDSWFSEGLREDIYTALGRITALSVRGQASAERLRREGLGNRETASALGVAYLVEASTRIIGEQLRVIVHLIDGVADEEIWSDVYETPLSMSAVTDIQASIAENVASRVGARIAPGEQEANSRLSTDNLAAHQLVHEARNLWNQRSELEVREAIRLFQGALALDPDYAEAYAGLADAYGILADYSWEPASEVTPPAIAAAERALELNPSLAGAHVALASVRQQTRDWAGADAHYRQALRLDPNHAYARFWYSILLDAMGRFDEGLEQATLAVQLDPLVPQIKTALWNHFIAIRDFDGAMSIGLELVGADPEFVNGWVFISEAYAGLGLMEEAREAKERADELEGEPLYGGLARLLALAGDREGALTELDRVRTLVGPDGIDPKVIAQVYVALGDFDEAFRYLYRARDEGSVAMEILTHDWSYDPIRSDPRFASLLEELNLPVIDWR